MARNGSWLCPTDLDKLRVIDSSDRVRRARLTGAAAIGVVAVASGPWLGWTIVAVFVAVALNLLTLDIRLRRTERPERTVAASLLFTEAAIGIGVALTGGAASPALPWMAVPIGMTAARFRPGVLPAALAIGAGITLLVAIVPDPAGAWADPWLLAATLALEVNVVAVATALQGAELQHRSEKVLDPLTDLLNRSSLETRFAELSEQARRNDGTVAIVVLDLDDFKAVNDEHGHAVGDAVLRDLSYEMRKALRNFELFYRYGGEEFVVVLPGACLDEAIGIAERMRVAVELASPAGLKLTVSAGAAVARGAAVAFEPLFRAADEALYAAKRRGRNRVWPEAVLDAAAVRPDRRRASVAAPGPILLPTGEG
jgi:diguanylate cyclase (GGDEF)-like protein